MIIDLSEKLDSRILAEMCGGKINSAVEINSISIDSREVGKNTLFVAVKGEVTDGHKYIGSAVKNGAVCVMCEYVPEGVECNYILVGDTIKAISDIAAYCRNKINPFTVGVTGSVGKTTTKEFISYVLGEKYNTHKSGGNFNTVYGLSLTLAALSASHKAVVAEMGMSAFGEISQLTAIAQPDAAVITNIGTAHMEALGSRENICKAKLEIIEGLKENGTLIYNGDEPLLWEKREAFPQCISIGIKNSKVNVFGSNIRCERFSTVFDMQFKGEIIKDISIPTVGEHNVYNAMAAYACGVLAGMSEDEIRRGLGKYVPSGMRQRIYDKKGFTVIEDCYNASPESMKAALSVLSSVGKGKRKIAVLGDMRELGDNSVMLHRGVGAVAAEQGIDMVCSYGGLASDIAESASENGVGSIYCHTDCNDPAGMAEYLKGILKEGDVVLFKASRAVSLEKVIELL